MDLNALSLSVQNGQVKKVKELVQLALSEKIEPDVILNDGMISAMSIVGEKFKNGEAFVPEMLIAARAMVSGLEILEPILTEKGVKSTGKVVIGTVLGDLHDIGKNLVAMMLKGAGFEIYDIGIDASSSKFIDAAENIGADVICMSALLTTTMPMMKNVIDDLKERKIRDKYKVMIGGAPVTQEYCEKIGADIYAPDAATAAEVLKKLLHS